MTGSVSRMLPSKQGALRLFRFAGIQVYLHPSWFIAAVYFIGNGRYANPLWNILQYLALFAIVLTHEFGHALACRQVGGRAEQIILWPFGGVAFVSPPQRPGAMLWSIAAGPLVNVVLLPIFYVAMKLTDAGPLFPPEGVEPTFLASVALVNFVLLVFNMLPFYPLDGGQILRSLLWFWLGPVRSLLVASAIGFVGVLAFAAFAFYAQSWWIGLMTVFVFLQCQSAWLNARAAARLAKMSRRAGFACPACGAPPPAGEIWRCGQCQQPFDPFVSQAVCPHCGAMHPTTQCVDCRAQNPIEKW